MFFRVATFICLFANVHTSLLMCSLYVPSQTQSLQTHSDECDSGWNVLFFPLKPLSVAPVVLLPLSHLPLLLTMLHIINQLWVGLPCKYPNESSFIKWLNGPDKSPNEEINNSVIVTVLILIRSSCSALIPAKQRSFFTVLSSACQQS